jgi:hypothetical protein
MRGRDHTQENADRGRLGIARGTGNAAQFLMCQLPHAATFTLAPTLSHDLQNQRDKFALAMGVGLGKDRFQLIARRLP